MHNRHCSWLPACGTSMSHSHCTVVLAELSSTMRCELGMLHLMEVCHYLAGEPMPSYAMQATRCTCSRQRRACRCTLPSCWALQRTHTAANQLKCGAC